CLFLFVIPQRSGGICFFLCRCLFLPRFWQQPQPFAPHANPLLKLFKGENPVQPSSTDNLQLTTSNCIKKYRAIYCARNYPLPLLPSGPGGVGGITSRRARHSPSLPSARNLHPTLRPLIRSLQNPLLNGVFHASYNSSHPPDLRLRLWRLPHGPGPRLLRRRQPLARPPRRAHRPPPALTRRMSHP